MEKSFIEAVRKVTDRSGNIDVAIIPLNKVGRSDAMDYAQRYEIPASKIIESHLREQTLDI